MPVLQGSGADSTDPGQPQPLQEKYNLTFIRVDLTAPDKVADQFLRALGSRSIPLAAIFKPGEDSSSPTVIRDLYTTGQMDEALSQTLK